MRSCSSLLAVVALLFASLACAGRDHTVAIDDARLLAANADSANWLTYGRTYDEQRFSPLREVNDSTVARLGLVWSHELGTTRALEASPIVVDGIMYTTGSWSVVYAYDAATGRQLWTYDPKVDRTRVRNVCCDIVNRGVAVYKGLLYLGALDGRLIAIHATTGLPAWDVLTIDPAKPYAITGAPRIAKGKVLIGNAGAEFGVRGYISAYDAASGKLAWRVYAVPGDPAQPFESRALEVAAKTWHGEWWKNGGGGGTTWDPIVYDPELDQVYFGTGNGTAWYRDLRSPGGGDNLYLASILAVKMETGEQVWHYQVTPGDNWDFDATQPLVQATLTIAGAARKVVMQPSKNGFFYVIDRVTGKLISGTQFVDGVTWASGIDSVTGRPIETKVGYDGMNPVLSSPDNSGAHNWNPIAMDPTRGLVFLGARGNSLEIHAPDKDYKYDPTTSNLGKDGLYAGPLWGKFFAHKSKGELIAWNPVERKAAWRVELPSAQSGGTLATAGNLVMQGAADGIIRAFRSQDGTKLWEFNAGTGVMAPPVTYLAGGRQYVTVMVGWGGPSGLVNWPTNGLTRPGYGRILTFALGGSAKLTVPFYGHTTPPTAVLPVTATPPQLQLGGVLYNRYCLICHGVNVVSGPTPDLRYSTAATHKQLASIVLDGARVQLGMPSFKDKLDTTQLALIQQYILAQAAVRPAAARTASRTAARDSGSAASATRRRSR